MAPPMITQKQESLAVIFVQISY